jgi:hypothetical protein
VSDDTVIFKDFSRKRKPIKFKIDDDVFLCVPALSTFAMQDLMIAYRGIDVKQALADSDVKRIMDAMKGIFSIFIESESFQLFVHRLDNDRKNPIDVQQLLEIISWIVEVYTNRPSQPSENSSSGSLDGNAGTASPDGAQLEELIPQNSISVGSSILPTTG